MWKAKTRAHVYVYVLPCLYVLPCVCAAMPHMKPAREEQARLLRSHLHSVHTMYLDGEASGSVEHTARHKDGASSSCLHPNSSPSSPHCHPLDLATPHLLSTSSDAGCGGGGMGHGATEEAVGCTQEAVGYAPQDPVTVTVPATHLAPLYSRYYGGTCSLYHHRVCASTRCYRYSIQML